MDVSCLSWGFLICILHSQPSLPCDRYRQVVSTLWLITMEQGGVEMLQLVFFILLLTLRIRSLIFTWLAWCFSSFLIKSSQELEICSGIPTWVYVTLSPFPVCIFPPYIFSRNLNHLFTLLFTSIMLTPLKMGLAHSIVIELRKGNIFWRRFRRMYFLRGFKLKIDNFLPWFLKKVSVNTYAC